MCKCKNCIRYNGEKQNCSINNKKLTETEIYVEVGLCDNYVPTLEYVKEKNGVKDEVLF